MIDPTTLVDAVVTALQSITDLVTALNEEKEKIYAFHYMYGADHRFAEAVFRMPAPSIMVVYDGTMGGNFDGQTIWKHRVHVYIRAANMANVASQVSYEKLIHMILNHKVNNIVNIRYTNMLTNVDICDTPSTSRLVDEENMDYFRIDFVFPEIGDD